MGPLIYCEFVHYEQGIPGNQNAEAPHLAAVSSASSRRYPLGKSRVQLLPQSQHREASGRRAMADKNSWRAKCLFLRFFAVQREVHRPASGPPDGLLLNGAGRHPVAVPIFPLFKPEARQRQTLDEAERITEALFPVQDQYAPTSVIGALVATRSAHVRAFGYVHSASSWQG
jgi:hypothetical protein